MTATTDNHRWMQIALDEADLAASKGEVPVGAVLVDAAGREIARGHNARETLADPTAHAEMVAIREGAARSLGWRLEGVTAYVTLEPCAMCAGALVHARVARVVYGCADPKGGAVDTMFGIGRDSRLNHRFEVTAGVLAEECAERLRRFFAALRGASVPSLQALARSRAPKRTP
jgi:tRNA(adenine34) deaminase